MLYISQSRFLEKKEFNSLVIGKKYLLCNEKMQ